jgi:hypothetical protein
MDLQKRRMFWNGQLHLPDGESLVTRDKVCAMEIWAECFNGDTRYLKRQESTEIINILSTLRGWKRNKSVRRYGPYGTQKGFEKV